jgi:hypothetical protein
LTERKSLSGTRCFPDKENDSFYLQQKDIVYRQLIFSPVLLLSLLCSSQEKKFDTAVVEVELVKIEMEKFEPPPPPNFDLRLFNIFVLKNGNIYYYYDSTFTPKNEWDEYKGDNLHKSLLHKTSKRELKQSLQMYLRATNGTKVVLAVENYDKAKVDMIFKEVLKPLKISEVQVGYVTEELLEILQKIK